MNWISRLFSILAVISLAVFLAGCGESKDVNIGDREINEFHAAVAESDGMTVERLIKAHPKLVNMPNAKGVKPLTTATKAGNSEAVEVLKKHGAEE